MSGLSKVATALTVVFAVSLAILIGDLLYVLWRRRRFLQRSLAGGDPEITGDPFYTPSKELLYFFCWKNQSRIEPATAGAPPLPQLIPEEDELAKWQVYGPPRVLFTIKEEEKEDLESEKCSYEEKRVCLKDGFEDQVLPEIAVVVEVEVEVEVEVDVDVDVDVDEATPFSTPCGTPPFYTPSPSPSRDDTESERLHRDHSLESEGFSENDASFVTIKIHA